MSFIVHRVAKSAARYTDAGGREKCGYCRFFVPPRSCGKVIGPVSPAGWCKHFSRQMVSQFGGGNTPVGGGPPGKTLDLDFMSSGNMPAGVTFTRASTATYTDSTGTIQTAAINAPRWDYAGGSLRGLLIEEARTNVVTNSIPVGAPWAVADVTTTAASGIAPDGANTMVRVAETATTAFHTNYCAVTLVASTVYTASVYAKAAQNRYLQLMFDNGASSQLFATFDLQTGGISGALAASGGASVGTAIIQSVGNGIYRCAISGTLGAFTVGRVFTTLSNVANPGVLPSYAGNAANGLLVWGAQLEQGAFPTSHIPTTSVSVTRAADVASMPTNVSWYDATRGSAMTTFTNVAQSSGGTLNGLFEFDDGTNANIIMAMSYALGTQSTAVSQIFVASANTGYVNAGAITTTPIMKQISAWAPTSTLRETVNGAAITSSPSTTVPTVNQLLLGWGRAGQAPLNGYLRQFTYWNRALSDAEMQQVTT